MGRRAESPGPCTQWMSGFVRDAGVDGEGVNPARHQGVQGIIYEAMPGQAIEAFEAPAGDPHAEVAALAGAGMTGMAMAVVLHLERCWRQSLAKGGVDVGRGDAHAPLSPTGAGSTVFGVGSSAISTWRATAKPCASMNTNIIPVRPNTLKLAQVDVE